MTEEVKTQEQAPAQPTLEIRDIAIATQIIGLASQRGAIQAEEMEAVGMVYNKMKAFVEAAQPPQTDEKVKEEDEEAAS